MDLIGTDRTGAATWYSEIWSPTYLTFLVPLRGKHKTKTVGRSHSAN